MIKAVRQRNRYGARDAALIRVAYRHGYRISELVDLRWSDIDFAHGRLAVRRCKGSLESVHPLDAFELRALRALQRIAKTDYVFESERGTPMHKRNAQVMIEKAGRAARLDFPVCAHQLRHGAGYRLANQGATTRDIQVFLGHKNLSNVERYTALAADRFKGF
jgi:type 1 fimbriae regulatory protein FimE